MARGREGGSERNEDTEDEDEDEEEGGRRPLGRDLRHPHKVRNAEHARCRTWCDATGMSSRASSCCSVRRREGGTRGCTDVENDTAMLR